MLGRAVRQGLCSDCVCGMTWQAYDLTKFAKVHPGGAKLITDAAGMDATAIFDPIHPKEHQMSAKKHGRDSVDDVHPMGTGLI